MSRRLADIEAEQEAERKKAARWLKRNEHKLESEELPREQADGGRRRISTPRGFYDEVFEHPVKGNNQTIIDGELFIRGWHPLVGRPKVVNIEELGKAKRVTRALETMPVRQQELLRAHYVEGLSLRELAEHGETRQAVHQRMERARDRLVDTLEAQMAEPIILREEDF